MALCSNHAIGRHRNLGLAVGRNDSRHLAPTAFGRDEYWRTLRTAAVRFGGVWFPLAGGCASAVYLLALDALGKDRKSFGHHGADAMFGVHAVPSRTPRRWPTLSTERSMNGGHDQPYKACCPCDQRGQMRFRASGCWRYCHTPCNGHMGTAFGQRVFPNHARVASSSGNTSLKTRSATFMMRSES